MRNAQNQMAGHRPLPSGTANETMTFHSMLSEAGLNASLCLEWLLDRVENPEART